MGKPKNSVSKSPKSAEPVDLSTSRDDEEVVTMTTVRSLLVVQESMLKTLLESVVNGINARMDDLERSVSDIKASLEFSQTEIEDLKPLRPKLKEAEENLIRVHNSIEYLENQSRRNNIRVSGIPESPGQRCGMIQKIKRQRRSRVLLGWRYKSNGLIASISKRKWAENSSKRRRRKS